MSFSSELRFMRALDLYNHCHAMDFALVGGNDGFGGGLFPAACGLGSGAMQGPAAPFRPEQKASIHLWINDKLDAVGFKKECLPVPGSFITNYGAKEWKCAVCSASILLADHGGRKLAAQYWTRPKGRKWCKGCVQKELRTKLGNDDSKIKVRYRALVGPKWTGRKARLLMASGVSGFVNFSHEQAETEGENDEDDEDARPAKKAKKEGPAVIGEALNDSAAEPEADQQQVAWWRQC